MTRNTKLLIRLSKRYLDITPRGKWRHSYRLERIKRKEAYKEEHPQGYGLGQSRLMSALKALYNYSYTPEQSVFISLFYKYRDKFDRPTQTRYLKRVHKWMPEARQRARGYIKTLVYAHNPLMSLIPKKDDSWAGKYISVPLQYGIADE